MSKATVKVTNIVDVLNLIKTPKYKIKQGGEARTHSAVVDMILDDVPEHVWKKEIKFLDPCCGRGTFILRVIDKLLQYHNTQSILSMIKGIDIDVYCVYTTKQVIAAKLNIDPIELDNVIVKADFLSWETEMKFDVIVGNPPFQESKEDGDRKDQASNLWSKFWAKSFKLTKPDSVIALITPTSWLSPSADLKGKDKIDNEDRLWNVFNKHTSRANVVDVSKHFQGVGSSFGYVVVDRAGTAGLSFSDGASTSLGFLPKSNFASVAKELDQVNNIGNKFSVDQDNKQGMRVSIPMTRKLTKDNIEILNGPGQPLTGSDKENLYIYVHVTTQAEADRVKQRVIDCVDILNVDCRWSGFLNIKMVKLISY
jgi:tRNA1(Val) A37 N6-methylase TrmN6